MMLDPNDYPLKEEMVIADTEELLIEVSSRVKYAEDKTVKSGRVLGGIVDRNGVTYSVYVSALGDTPSQQIVPGVSFETKVKELMAGSTSFVDTIVSVTVHRTACPVTLLISEVYDYQALGGERSESSQEPYSVVVKTLE